MSDESPVFFRYKDPKGPPNWPALTVQFREDAQKNEAATLANGYDTYDNVLVALVAPTGQPKSNALCEIERRLPDGTVKQHPIFAKQYAEVVKLYKEGKGDGAAGGTPLKQLSVLDRGLIMTLKAKGIHSIEMLAEISDTGGQDLMGFRGFRETAQQFLALREKEAPTKRLEMELAEQAKVNASLTRQLEELRALVEAEPPRRGPGRPRKDEQEAA